MARRHKRLIEVKEVKLDGHVHVFSNPRPRANKFWRDPGSRKLIDLVSCVEKAGVNSVALTNAGDDWLYERFVSQARDLPAGYGFYQDERITQVLTQDGRACTFIKAEELFTTEGHLLVWGTRFGEMYQPIQGEFKLKDAFERVGEDKLLTLIADHAWLYSKLGSGLGASGALDNEEVRKKIDAEEDSALVARVDREAHKKVLRREKQGIVVVHNSDAHRYTEIGTGFNVFAGRDLGWDNGNDFVASLKENVRANNFTGKTSYVSYLGVLHHAYMLGLDHKAREIAINLLGKVGLGKLAFLVPAPYEKDVATDDFDIERTRKLIN